MLPLYLRQSYDWHAAELDGRPCILALSKVGDEIRLSQVEKQLEQARTVFGLPVIVVFDQLEAYNRKRLIEKRVAFVVPDKQLYVPDFLLDLKEFGLTNKKPVDTLTPFAQVILLYHILYRNNDQQQLENKTFRQIGDMLKINPMGISRAVDNLKHHELIEVKGEREKFIRFRLDRAELWGDAERRKLLINPVIKKVFTAKKPKEAVLYSNTSALPEYTNMNASARPFYALDKNVFYELQKNNALDAHDHDEPYCIEIWNYDPMKLAQELPTDMPPVVDPLSLYLSLKDTRDERIEMALHQITQKYIW